MKRIIAALILITLALPAWQAAAAGIPATISYQGTLTDKAGAPVGTVAVPVSKDLTFRLYSVSSGGTAFWSETQTGVTITNGLFSVALGSVTPIDIGAFGGDTWLGIQVGTDTEMSPRQRLTSVPYAFNAQNAVNAATAATATSAGSVTNGVYTTGDQTIAGSKTFSSPIIGSITGSAATATSAGSVTNGVYTTGDQTIAGSKTFSSPIIGSITGSAATATSAGSVTNGVYTTGDQTIAGSKTFSSPIIGSITGSAATATSAGSVTNGVYTTGDQTIAGSKTFSSPIIGSITGSAATATSAGSVTNGVYTTGDQTIAGSKTFSSPIIGSITGSAATATAAVTAQNVTSTDSILPPGTIVAFGGTNAPAGWLLCDGSPVSRTVYSRLFLALDSGAIHGTGDGSATFNLPDYRGRFLRGAVTQQTVGVSSVNTIDYSFTVTGGHGFNRSGFPVQVTSAAPPAPLVAGTTYYIIYVSPTVFKLATSEANAVNSPPTTLPITSTGNGALTFTQAADPDAVSRIAATTGGNLGNAVGSVQGDAFQAHTHYIEPYWNVNPPSDWPASGSHALGYGVNGLESINMPYYIKTKSTIDGNSSNFETRPKNAYVNWIIKY